ncbi:MAG: hypothetical protein GEU73_05375, partial [Chloroflexi bacterium]|nr:hypothetical protein [Chloroflexota bacterium]
MGRSKHICMSGLILAIVLAGCAPAGPGVTSGTGSQAQEPTGAKKRIVAGFLKPDLLAISALPVDSEGRHIAQMVHAGFAQEDDAGRLHPQLAEAIPTLENGLWKLLPDGRMETTWTIKENARWHDGTPVTAADLRFGATVQQDRALGIRISPGWAAVEGIEAPDPRTVIVTWGQPNIEADVMVGSSDQLLPRHLLEQAYTNDKATFMDHPYWTDEFVGAGPFKLREY